MKTIQRATSTAIFLAAGVVAIDHAVQATPYWRCPNGFTFAVNNAGTGAHCAESGNTAFGPINCPRLKIAGQTFGALQVAKSGKDVCRATAVVGGFRQSSDGPPLPCSPGYEYAEDYQGNVDKCTKTPTHNAPSVQFDSSP
jgi:hypothetical protein